MAMQNIIFSQTIRKDGHFNYPDFYHFCTGWFDHENYDMIESVYNDKAQSPGKQIELLWEPYREVTDYFKFVIQVELVITHLVSAEIERDGKKEKTNKGNLKMKVRGILVKDYEDRWEVKPLYKFLRGMYEQYIIKTTMDVYEERLAKECAHFVGDVKAFLELM